VRVERVEFYSFAGRYHQFIGESHSKTSLSKPGVPVPTCFGKLILELL
jgi:hypothetical protein